MLSSLLIAALFGVGLAAQVFPYMHRNYTEVFDMMQTFSFLVPPS